MSKVLVLTVIEADYQWDDNELVVKASDYDQLKALFEASKRVTSAVIDERDTLRKQLAEACELLNDSRNKINYMMQNGEWYQPQFLLERIDDWLEANKP